MGEHNPQEDAVTELIEHIDVFVNGINADPPLSNEDAAELLVSAEGLVKALQDRLNKAALESFQS